MHRSSLKLTLLTLAVPGGTPAIQTLQGIELSMPATPAMIGPSPRNVLWSGLSVLCSGWAIVLYTMQLRRQQSKGRAADVPAKVSERLGV